MIEAPDVDAAKKTLVEWLDAWLIHDWRRMADFTSSSNGDLDARTPLLEANFCNRKITQHTEPKFKDGNMEALDDDDKVGFADFDVSVALTEGRGSESFVARVVGVNSVWGVNAVSTMKRTTSPPGKGEQCQQRRRQRVKSSQN